LQHQEPNTNNNSSARIQPNQMISKTNFHTTPNQTKTVRNAKENILSKRKQKRKEIIMPGSYASIQTQRPSVIENTDHEFPIKAINIVSDDGDDADEDIRDAALDNIARASDVRTRKAFPTVSEKPNPRTHTTNDRDSSNKSNSNNNQSYNDKSKNNNSNNGNQNNNNSNSSNNDKSKSIT